MYTDDKLVVFQDMKRYMDWLKHQPQSSSKEESKQPTIKHELDTFYGPEQLFMLTLIRAHEIKSLVTPVQVESSNMCHAAPEDVISPVKQQHANKRSVF